MSWILKLFSRDLAPSSSPLANREDLTGTFQPTLGVLLFPVSPSSRKGATHTKPREKYISQLTLQVWSTTPYRAKHPNSHKKINQEKYWQRNRTPTGREPYSSSAILFIEFS